MNITKNYFMRTEIDTIFDLKYFKELINIHKNLKIC